MAARCPLTDYMGEVMLLSCNIRTTGQNRPHMRERSKVQAFPVHRWNGHAAAGDECNIPTRRCMRISSTASPGGRAIPEQAGRQRQPVQDFADHHAPWHAPSDPAQFPVPPGRSARGPIGAYPLHRRLGARRPVVKLSDTTARNFGRPRRPIDAASNACGCQL